MNSLLFQVSFPAIFLFRFYLLLATCTPCAVPKVPVLLFSLVESALRTKALFTLPFNFTTIWLISLTKRLKKVQRYLPSLLNLRLDAVRIQRMTMSTNSTGIYNVFLTDSQLQFFQESPLTSPLKVLYFFCLGKIPLHRNISAWKVLTSLFNQKNVNNLLPHIFLLLIHTFWITA